MELTKYTYNRNFGLDVIRTISIMLVVVSHTFHTTNLELGVWGVEVFFVLSGFLIGQILIKDFKDGITIKKAFNFWKRRWFRTLPLYYLVIILKFFFFDSSLGYKIIAYLFFLQNNFVGISFLGVSWSLVIEEWFYLLLPIAFFVFFKNGFNKQKFSFFLIGSILMVILLRCSWVLYTNRPFDAIRSNFIFRFDSLLIGVLLSNIKLYFQKTYTQLCNLFYFVLGLLLMIILIYKLGNTHNLNLHPFYRTIWFAFFSLSIALTIPFFESSNFIKDVSKVKILFVFFTWTSILTYSIYLLHMFVFNISIPFLVGYWKLVAQLVLLYSISFLIFILYEHPMTKLRDKI